MFIEFICDLNNRDLIKEILQYLNQFDVNKLLRLNKTINNNTILRDELIVLRKWCSRRTKTIYIRNPKYIFINENDMIIRNADDKAENVIFHVDLRTDIILEVLPWSADIFSYVYKKDDTIANYNSVYLKVLKNIYYYPQVKYNLFQKDDIIIKVKNLNIKVCIKVKGDCKYRFVEPDTTNEYHFALY